MDVDEEVRYHHKYLQVSLRIVLCVESADHLRDARDTSDFQYCYHFQSLWVLLRELLPRYATDKINKHLSFEVFQEYLASIILFEPILVIIACTEVYQNVKHVNAI